MDFGRVWGISLDSTCLDSSLRVVVLLFLMPPFLLTLIVQSLLSHHCFSTGDMKPSPFCLCLCWILAESRATPMRYSLIFRNPLWDVFNSKFCWNDLIAILAIPTPCPSPETTPGTSLSSGTFNSNPWVLYQYSGGGVIRQMSFEYDGIRV